MIEKRIEINGVATRYFEAGDGDATVLLLHAGAFSNNGLCLSSLVWDHNVPSLARDFRVLAVDTLGQGRTAQPSDDVGYSFRGMIDHARAFIEQSAEGKVHLVGHDEGALLALRLAFECPSLVASCSVVDSPTAAPVGDGIGNMTLVSPMQPLYSRAGQRWALEQMSYSPHHIAPALLDEAVSVSETNSFREQRAKLEAGGLYERQVLPDIAQLRLNNFARWRDEGLDVPIQVIWGLQNPMSPIHYARTLYGIISARVKVCQLHLINRAGYFSFREQPAVFNELVRGFVRANQVN
jgi:pimeloyl-ACP methyl ester carboxylesterase